MDQTEKSPLGGLPSMPKLLCYLGILGMGQGGVEPPTSRLSGVRSNHLSYWPAGFTM